MTIRSITAPCPELGRPTVSFELYPPRNAADADRLPHTLAELSEVNPDFVSVTFGASGSARHASLDVVRQILDQTTMAPLAHLTCVGMSRAEVAELIEEFLRLGVRAFLALRGDPPRGQTVWRPHQDGLVYAQQLIAMLRRIEREQVPGQLSVSVAAFPTKHPQSISTRQDVAVLAAKQRAGADFAITQLFYSLRDYTTLVRRAREAGVTMPIVPGVMPLTNPARLRRMSQLCQVPPPEDLLERLERAKDGERLDIGIAATVELSQALLDAGAPGLHIYTLNRSAAPVRILRELGMAGSDRPVQTAQGRMPQR